MTSQSNASDLVEQLRGGVTITQGLDVSTWKPEVLLNAADEIERLRAQLAAAEAEKLELANHADGCVRVAAEALQGRQTAEAQLDAARKALEEIARTKDFYGDDASHIAREALRTLTPGADK